MSFLLFLVILATIFIAHFLKFNRISRSLLFLLIVLFVSCGTGVVPHFLLMSLQEKYNMKPVIRWQDENAIVLLGGGTQKVSTHESIEPSFFSYGRLLETGIQYKKCQEARKICTVIVSGGDVLRYGISEAENYKIILINLGVKESDIITESESLNTWQNAELTSKILKSHRFTNIILISSGLHMRRSEVYFRHFGIVTTPIRADYIDAMLSFIPLWYNFAMTDLVLHEYIGQMRYDLYTYMNWNNKRMNPGDA